MWLEVPCVDLFCQGGPGAGPFAGLCLYQAAGATAVNPDTNPVPLQSLVACWGMWCTHCLAETCGPGETGLLVQKAAMLF